MTPKQRLKLLKEIAGLDKRGDDGKTPRERMRQEIEESGRGGKDINAYADWAQSQPDFGREPIEANPDQLAEGGALQWGQTRNFNLVGLSDSEREAWELCKEMSYTRKDAAEEMGVAIGTLNKLLSRAQAKLRGQL